MKKIIFTVVLAAVVSTVSLAQIGYGVKAGLNLSKLKSEYSDNNFSVSSTSDNRVSFHVGGFLVKTFSEKLALQPEFVISSEGGMEEDGDDKSVAKYTFINIPVLVRYTIIENLNVYGGPQIGFNISAKYKTEIDGDTEEGDIDDVSTLGLGLGLGVGYYVTEQIEIGFRYNFGLTNWYNGDESDNNSVNINTIQLGLAYKIK